MKKGGTFYARIALDDLDFEDVEMTGDIPVIVGSEVVLARSLNDAFTFKVPTKEFFLKYKSDLRVVVERAHDTDNRLWWKGFKLNHKHSIEEIKSDYPYVDLIYFNEEFTNSCNSKVGSRYYQIKHTDGTFIRISPDEELIHLFNKETNQSVKIHTKTSVGDEDATKQPAVLGDEAVSLMNSFLDEMSEFAEKINEFCTLQESVSTGYLSPYRAGFATLRTQSDAIKTAVDNIKSTKVNPILSNSVILD
ncbi:hypothetical protein Molly5_92 [Maribacter phage Molly_5]|uniref:Uncharacterized protein n=2 Tax=Mollyvirus TaxID=2948826 RepID=A0A8E4UY42_9CAUD|nr:hypothetical protein M1M29_gp092 [Maribacter phage Molly_1]YP_010357339.1 hypothetical protein M1M30_gp090 [Maribacter phage Colly_1]QQO97780.1 hypothetical protein Molly2_92 [Maribacter phage Molly_2]QQO97980.1 hypothetical protein Molly3_92 [Maribacter phage Molly_3]QQO98180.1 hypothetical protein Molly4_92 [Maribacter phage Molly_4]QQO98380.1 hypothetical protein Molly5_92 [Maribacter phage Molly_5]QQO97378.1 hypothetical protein Colly1_90 [Maribacter phage Colly_1]